MFRAIQGYSGFLEEGKSIINVKIKFFTGLD